jgi:hypothetical protein
VLVIPRESGNKIGEQGKFDFLIVILIQIFDLMQLIDPHICYLKKLSSDIYCIVKKENHQHYVRTSIGLSSLKPEQAECDME